MRGLTAVRALLCLALGGAAFGVAACNGAATGSAGSLATVPGAPAPVDGYDWFLHADGDEARLAYGLEASDDLRLGMDCRRGAGRLELSAVGDEGQRDIHVESGGETERFPATAEPSEVNDGVFLSARAPADAPVFQRFRRVGWLAVWQGDQRQAYAPQPGSAGNIERFFAFCG